MNKNTFILSLASLTLAVVGVSAVSTPNDSEITHLPAYRFETARYTPAERAVNASLAELRSTAKAFAMPVVMPAVADKLATDKVNVAAAMTKQPTATRVAKN